MLPPIDTPRIPVSTTYHGVAVTEDYRWLEDAGAQRVRDWTAAQDRRTRDHLAGLPFHAALRRRVAEVLTSETATYWALRQAGAGYLAVKEEPPRQQPFLVVLPDLGDLSGERVLVDPVELDATGATAIDWYQPSPDGGLVAVSLSSHGTEDGSVHVYETASGKPTGTVVPRVLGGPAASSVAWTADSTGFWYARFPSPGERPDSDAHFYQEVWFHRLGDPPGADRRELAGAAFADDRIAENFLDASPDGRWVLDRVQRGDSGEWQLFARSQAADGWWLVADVADRVAYATFGDGELYLLSRLDAPNGRVLRLPLRPGATVADAVEVLPETGAAVQGASLVSPHGGGGLVATGSALWVLEMDGGWSSLRVLDLAGGGPARAVPVPPSSTVDGLFRLGGDEVGYAVESYTEPRSWWRAGERSEPRRTALATSTPLDLSGYEVRREFAVSRDGTRVPVTLISGPGTPRDGTAPALLTGYGGYGVAMTPRFDPGRLLWLERGVVFAVAHLRGGSEYGEAWHHAGRLAAKQNVFDDFEACARLLVSSGVTSADRLAIMGGSNGGLLMGATLTQHPELCRAVVAMVPVLDMLRVELHPNGVFNIPEYGTVRDPELFRVLHAYSPYHHVEDGVAYPAVLLTAGEFDPRVDAYHAKKMTARLQAATSSDRPVLLRVESGGHGLSDSLDQRIAELTDVHAFVLASLDLVR